MKVNLTKPVLNTYWFYIDMFMRKEGVLITSLIPTGFVLHLGICFQGHPYSEQLVPHCGQQRFLTGLSLRWYQPTPLQLRQSCAAPSRGGWDWSFVLCLVEKLVHCCLWEAEGS